MTTVASATVRVLAVLGVNSVNVLGWSGGAPYALAASERLGRTVTAVHLVSPVPGPLTGPDAVPDQSERLRQIASTRPTSSWAMRPGALRDYRTVAAPWPFDVRSIHQPVTVWAPTDDDIVPPQLVSHLTDQLTQFELISVSGSHDWLMKNWSTVLQRLA